MHCVGGAQRGLVRGCARRVPPPQHTTPATQASRAQAPCPRVRPRPRPRPRSRPRPCPPPSRPPPLPVLRRSRRSASPRRRLTSAPSARWRYCFSMVRPRRPQPASASKRAPKR
ncbi:MAG TPA: hypothetical protein ENK23_04620 [Sorangium sp.]|nr:hypothetical protein [Sorangium sp.]